MYICHGSAQYAYQAVDQVNKCPSDSFADVRGSCQKCKPGEYMVAEGISFVIKETSCSPYIEGQYILLQTLYNNRPAYRKTDLFLFIYYEDAESSWFLGGTLGGFDAIAFANSESMVMPLTTWQEKCNYPELCTFSCPWTNNAKWSIVGSGFCQKCPFSSYSVAGSSSINNCICNPGSFGVIGESCQACLPGTYKLPSQPSSSLCTKCPINSMSSGASTIFCMCDSGWATEVPGEECKQCPAGTYSRDNMGTFCEKCVPGKYSSSVGSSSRTTCLSCATGTHSNKSGAEVCVSCSAGTYAEITGSSICVNCMSQTYSSVVASSSSRYCLDCPLGINSTAGSTSILDCNRSTNPITAPTTVEKTETTLSLGYLMGICILIAISFLIYFGFHLCTKKQDQYQSENEYSEQMRAW